MPCAGYMDTNLQNACSKRFMQGVEDTNLFVWNFFGEVIHATVNRPGGWHDNKLAGQSGLHFRKLSDEMTPPCFALLGDSAFVNNIQTTKGKVIRRRKSNETNYIPLLAGLTTMHIILQRVLQSEWQSAKWASVF